MASENEPWIDLELIHDEEIGDEEILESVDEALKLADEDETTVCWTCGGEVEREAIDDTPDSLRSLCQKRSHERIDLDTELDYS